jgi:hypothetical protein
MRKIFTLTVMAGALLVFSNCNPGKKAASKPIPKTTYATGLSVVISNYCTPCHILAKGGRKKAFDTYVSVRTDIDEMIRRIELNPTDKGFMPFRSNARLSDSVISVFKKWRNDGLLEN